MAIKKPLQVGSLNCCIGRCLPLTIITLLLILQASVVIFLTKTRSSFTAAEYLTASWNPQISALGTSGHDEILSQGVSVSASYSSSTRPLTSDRLLVLPARGDPQGTVDEIALIEDKIGGISVLRSSEPRLLASSSGLVLLFHGCMHTKDVWKYYSTYRATVTELHRAGFYCVAFASASSEAGGRIEGGKPACWAMPPNDEDLLRTAAVIDAVLGPLNLRPRAPRTCAATSPQEDTSAATIPVYALGTSSGGNFVGILVSRLLLTAAVLHIGEISRAVVSEGPRTNAGFANGALGPAIEPASGGRLTAEWLASRDLWAWNAARRVQGTSLNFTNRSVLYIQPAGLPPLFFVPMPRDISMKPFQYATIDALHRLANVSLAPGLTPANKYGLSQNSYTTAALAGVASTLAGSPIHAITSERVNALWQATLTGVSPKAGISLLPIPTRPLCPWTMHAALPWWISPAASAALFQLFDDRGLFVPDNQSAIQRELKTRGLSEFELRRGGVLNNVISTIGNILAAEHNLTLPFGFDKYCNRSSFPSIAVEYPFNPLTSKQDTVAFSLSVWPPVGMRFGYQCELRCTDEFCKDDPQLWDPLSLQVDRVAISLLPLGGCREVAALHMGALVNETLQLWLTALKPQKLPHRHGNSSAQCSFYHPWASTLNFSCTPDALPLQAPVLEDRMQTSFYWELRGLSKLRTQGAGNSSEVAVLVSDPSAGSIAIEESRYCCDTGESFSSTSGDFSALRRRALHWLKRSVLRVLGDIDAYHDGSTLLASAAAAWLRGITNCDDELHIHHL